MQFESAVERRLCERAVKSFLDLLILSRLGNEKPMCGYDFVQLIHEEFRMHISTGTIYANLYALERGGLVKGHKSRRKRVYEITDRGTQFIEATYHALNPVQNWIKRIMKQQKS